MIKKLKIGLLVIALTFFVGVSFAHAANLAWTAATPIDMSSPDFDDITIASGSSATSLVLGVGSFVVTADTGETFTVSSTSRSLVISSTTGVVQTCTAGTSQIVITGSGSLIAYTIYATSTQCGTGGSGGGGGGTPVDTTPPTSTSISINAGATTTSSLSATLTLGATDATQMIISNDAGFAGASWESYATSKAWTLTSGDGVKTVYAKFRDASLNMSTAVSDTITVSGTGTVEVPNNEPTQGCSGGNQYNTSTGALCVNNVGPTAHGLYNFGDKTLKNGSRGEAVKELQRFLNAKLALGLAVDGKLGPKTIAVIKKWQKAHGLVADGLIGPKTKAMMNAEE